MINKKTLLCLFSFMFLNIFVCNCVDIDSSCSSLENSVYEILGKHSNLNKPAFERMTKWRKETKKLVESLNSNQIIINDSPDSNAVYLTFDDGPDPIVTPQIIDILCKNNVPGNFFFTGENIKKYPYVVKKAFENNNLVAGHTFSHSQLTTLSEEDIEKEILGANNLIEKITGCKPACFRPPYGDVNAHVINIAKKLNLKIVLWSTDTLDWSKKEREFIIKNVEENLRPGEIILMHSNSDKSETAKALDTIIKLIKSKNYKIKTFK